MIATYEKGRPIITALKLILEGKNPYYKDRLIDPVFVRMVSMALQSEIAEYTRICGGASNAS